MFREFFLIVLFAAAGFAQISSRGFKICHGVPSALFSPCILKQILRIQPQLAAGVPEEGLPRLEPLALGNIALRMSQPPILIDARFRQVMVSGFTSFDIKYLNAQWSKRVISARMLIPSMTIRGLYQLDGRVLELPLEGDGRFIMRMENVLIEMRGMIATSPNGSLSMKDVEVGFRAKRMQTKLDNLFPRNKVLRDTIDHFLNTNGDILQDELRPGIVKQMSGLVGGLFNVLFRKETEAILRDLPELNINESTKEKIKHVGDGGMILT